MLLHANNDNLIIFNVFIYLCVIVNFNVKLIYISWTNQGFYKNQRLDETQFTTKQNWCCIFISFSFFIKDIDSKKTPFYSTFTWELV